jgi:hypothetical protein
MQIVKSYILALVSLLANQGLAAHWVALDIAIIGTRRLRVKGRI